MTMVSVTRLAKLKVRQVWRLQLKGAVGVSERKIVELSEQTIKLEEIGRVCPTSCLCRISDTTWVELWGSSE